MPYQEGYDYGGYQGYGQMQQAHMYQTNHGQFPTQQPRQQQQQQHSMVVIPQQPRQNVSQYYTPPQSFQPQHQSAFYQQYPSQYEQATQQQYYYPQSQQHYPQGVQQQQQSFQNQFQSVPNVQTPAQPVLPQNTYQPNQTLDPRALYSGGQSSSYLQPQVQQHPRQQVQMSPQLPSSPDPLQTPQYQVQSRSLPVQQPPRSHLPANAVQQRSQQQSRQSSGPHPTPNSSQQRVVARVEIPIQQQNVRTAQSNAERPPKRRRSNEGHAMPVCEPAMSEIQNSQQHINPLRVTSSPLTELNSSQLPPTPKANLDYQAVLLALADEYIAAAYCMSTSLATSDESDKRHDDYYALMSTAMGCLETALTNYKQVDFRTEARLRLRLASLMAEETENDLETEEILSKGVALCERSRLSDLKYAMHHLLVRVTFKTRPKAALKALDKLVQEVEAFKLINWAYTFRFLRVSLCLQTENQSDTATVLKYLSAISVTAEDARHIPVHIMAAVFETIVHIRSGSADAVELAQRAMASARTHQLGPEMQKVPQARALLDCLDLACDLIQFNPEQVATKMQQMQNNLDTLTREAGWHKDGSMMLDLAPSNNDDLEKDTCGIMRQSGNGNAVLIFRWIPKTQLYALGYLLSGIANMYKNSGQPEKYLHEGLKLTKHSPDSIAQSLTSATESLERKAAISVAMHLHIIFAHCGRYDWVAAQNAIQGLRKDYSESELGIDDGAARTLSYLEALCKHGLGDLQAAVELYSSANLIFDPNKKTKIAEKDLRALATLNRIFIMRSLSVEQSAQADNLLKTIETYCTNHTNKSMKAVYYIVKATTQGSDNAIIKTKQYLQAAVEASKSASNNQLLSVVMNVMTATFFTHIVGDQAEKSAKAGRSLAKKGQDRLWTAVADGMYGDIMERCGKAAEAEAAREEARSLVSNLPESLKISLRTEESVI